MKRTSMRYYKKFCNGMILRDYLALDRTVLANKRTLLAYARTFIGLIAGGIGMVKLVEDGIINILGYIFIVVAFPILIIGIYEYFKIRSALDEIDKSDRDVQQ